MKPGTVYLIGAGPGDPGLITVRGRSLLERADIVVYDRLVHPALLRHARKDAELLYVGKSNSHHSMRQEEINALLIDRAVQGRIVARLKGGDPFVFGRGGEEAEACRAAGIPFEVVPGVTSAIAAPAYAGIPVTHRDAASSFAVITGHERADAGEVAARVPGAAEERRNWAQIANAADTLVFLMGVTALPEITARLIEHGRSPDTPVALIQWGSWTRQRVVTGTLATIGEVAAEARLAPPAVCVVGEVVRLREALRWFDDPRARPLLGKRILVTRAREQASALIDLLTERGAEPIEFPTVKIERTDNAIEQSSALTDLAQGAYDWVVITSANTVTALAKRIEGMNQDSRLFARAKIAAIGPATTDSLRAELGLRPDFVPTESVAEALIAEWPDTEMTGKRVLIPRAMEARDIVPAKLRERGAIVEVLPVYQTLADDSRAVEMSERLVSGDVDVLTFTSSSTVRNFVEALKNAGRAEALEAASRCTVAAIGPVTADTARELGLPPTIVAAEHTIPGLVTALEAHYLSASA